MAQSRKSLQSRKRRQERIRQEKHARKQDEAWERATAGSAFDMERLLRLVDRLRREDRLKDDRDAEALLARATIEDIRELQASLPEDPLEAAQELAFDAMEGESAGEALELAEEALVLDPLNLDALHLKATLEAGDPAGAVAALETVVATEEARWGEAYFGERMGRFWTLVETRPYMRVLADLAELLEQVDRPAEAARRYERLLELDHEDAQGHRFALVRASLAADRLKELRLFLVERQKAEPGPIFAWADVLERFRSEAFAGARQALLKARRLNPWVEDLLTGRRLAPRRTPLTAAPGSPEEAAQALEYIGKAWHDDRQAMAWLLRGGRIPGE